MNYTQKQEFWTPINEATGTYKRSDRDLKPGEQISAMWHVTTDIEHKGFYTFGRGGGIRVIDNETLEVDFGKGEKRILKGHEINQLVADEIEFQFGLPMIYEKTWRVTYRPDPDK